MAPQVEIAPAMTQSMRDMPGLPASLKIDAGVEKILLGVSMGEDRGPRRTHPAPMVLLTISEIAPNTPILRSWRICCSETCELGPVVEALSSETLVGTIKVSGRRTQGSGVLTSNRLY